MERPIDGGVNEMLPLFTEFIMEEAGDGDKATINIIQIRILMHLSALKNSLKTAFLRSQPWLMLL